MKKSTFILIASIYGFSLGIAMLLFPEWTLKHFNRDSTDIYQHSWVNFFGALHIAFCIVGISLRKSNNSAILKAYFSSLIFLNFTSIGLALYDVYVRQIPQHGTFYFDIATWAVIGSCALYFLSKEKE